MDEMKTVLNAGELVVAEARFVTGVHKFDSDLSKLRTFCKNEKPVLEKLGKPLHKVMAQRLAYGICLRKVWLAFGPRFWMCGPEYMQLLHNHIDSTPYTQTDLRCCTYYQRYIKVFRGIVRLAPRNIQAQ